MAKHEETVVNPKDSRHQAVSDRAEAARNAAPVDGDPEVEGSAGADFAATPGNVPFAPNTAPSESTILIDGDPKPEGQVPLAQHPPQNIAPTAPQGFKAQAVNTSAPTSKGGWWIAPDGNKYQLAEIKSVSLPVVRNGLANRLRLHFGPGDDVEITFGTEAEAKAARDNFPSV